MTWERGLEILKGLEKTVNEFLLKVEAARKNAVNDDEDSSKKGNSEDDSKKYSEGSDRISKATNLEELYDTIDKIGNLKIGKVEVSSDETKKDVKSLISNVRKIINDLKKEGEIKNNEDEIKWLEDHGFELHIRIMGIGKKIREILIGEIKNKKLNVDEEVESQGVEMNNNYSKSDWEDIVEELKKEAEKERQKKGEIEATGSKEIFDDFEQDYGKKGEEKGDQEQIKKDIVDDLGGKEFKPEENKAPEEKEKTAQERKEEIEKLKEEVEKRRKDYLDADYERKKAYKRIGSFFGKLFKDKQEKNLENDEEIAWYRAHYDDSLMQYKDARLEDARKNGASDKELLDIAKEFQLEANVNVADGVTQVKVENQEGRFSGFIKEHSKKIVEEYKKMSLTKKIAIGAAFGVAGVGSVYIGGVAVGIVGSAIAARRALLAVVTGTTVSLTAEAMGKKATDKKIEKEIENLEKEISGLNEEEKFKLITEFINKDIEDKNNKIDKIKNKNLRHLAYGMGAAIGTMILPKVTRMFSESTGASAWVKEHILGKMKAPNNLDMMEKSFPGEDKVSTSSYEKGSSYFSDQEGTETGKSAFDASETEKPMVTNVPEEDLQGKTPEVETETEVTLEVQKGSSLEGSLINYLNENPNLVERYNEFNGGKKFDVGQIAHRMALEYAEKNSEIFPQGPPSLIQEGSEISINTETMEIESIKNEKGIDYISKENSSGASTGEDVKIETNVEEKPFEKKSFPPNSERLEDPVIEMKSEVGPQEGQEAEIEMKSDSPVTDGQDTKTKMNIENESIIRDKVIDLFKSEGFDSGNQKVDTMMYLSDGSNQVWRNIKDLEFSKVGKNPNFDGEIEGKVMKRIKNLYETAGKELRPKKGEKIVTWVSHISEKTEV